MALTNAISNETPSLGFPVSNALLAAEMGHWIKLERRDEVRNCRLYKIRGRQKRKARSSGPFVRFSESYYFGSGSVPKFA